MKANRFTLTEPACFILAVALGIVFPGSLGCRGLGEIEDDLTTDASVQIHILKTGGSQVAFAEQSKVCEQAIKELKAMGPEVVPQIADALAKLPPEIDGSWLGLALIEFDEDAAPAAEVVFTRLTLGTNSVYTMVAVLDISGPVGRKFLLRALAPDNPDACIIAALGIVDVNTGDEGLAVARLFNHKNPEVREYALLSFVETGALGRSQLGEIRKAFRDQSEDVRCAAVRTAASVAIKGDKVTANALGNLLLVESDYYVVSTTIKALLLIKSSTPMVRRGLEQVARGGEDENKSRAVNALRMLFKD